MKIPYKIISIITLAGLLLDQLIKFLAEKYLVFPQSIFSFFSLRIEKNIGIAWSIPIPFFLIIITNLILLIAIPLLLFKKLNFDLKINPYLLGLILAGGLGNLIDRIFRGYVVDYIAIGNFPVFNLADTFLTVCIFIIVLFYDKITRSN